MIFSRHHVWRGELGWRDSWFVTKVGAPVITYMDSILLIIWERTESKSMVLHTFSSEYTYINNNYNEYNKLSVFCLNLMYVILSTDNCDCVLISWVWENCIYIYSMWPKVLPHVKKNPYIIDQNHIFSKNYCEVISG